MATTSIQLHQLHGRRQNSNGGVYHTLSYFPVLVSPVLITQDMFPFATGATSPLSVTRIYSVRLNYPPSLPFPLQSAPGPAR